MKKSASSALVWVYITLLLCLLLVRLFLPLLAQSVPRPFAAVYEFVPPAVPPLAALVLTVLFAVLFAVFCRRERRAVQSLLQIVNAYLTAGTPAKADEQARGTAGELAKAYNRLMERLEAANGTRADFMSNVSHDLKTPMTVIQGYVTNILNGAIPRSEEPKYLERIVREVRRLSGLVGIYQEVSRIDAGDWDFAAEPFDLVEKLQETLGIFLDRFESKNLGGDFECPEGPVTVLGDAEAIGRVLYCLFDNAVKFTPDGGVVNVSVTPMDRTVSFSIYNEGKGIAKEDLPYIFDRSFKADRSRGIEKDSFGLGLYLCQRILSYHSSQMTVESEEGKYCRFTFSLALACDRK